MVTIDASLPGFGRHRYRSQTFRCGLLRFRLRFGVSRRGALVNDNHPVLNALEAQLRELRLRYEHHPSEHNRYQLVRLERLITEWAPGSLN